MKKLGLILVMSVIALLSFSGVYAEEVVEVVAEPTSWDNWVGIMSDWASLKNFILSAGGFGVLIALVKLRGAWKYFKSPKGIALIETIGFNILSKITEKPELVVKIGAILVEMPIIKNILAISQKKANNYALELEGKMLDMEAKIAAEVYEGDKLQEATAYLTKLRTEYEATQLD